MRRDRTVSGKLEEGPETPQETDGEGKYLGKRLADDFQPTLGRAGTVVGNHYPAGTGRNYHQGRD